MKIAIITIYHQVYNIGALLQAYALNKTISKLGYDCETLSYSTKNKNTVSRSDKIINRIRAYGWTIIKYAVILPNRLVNRKKTQIVRQLQKERMSRLDRFAVESIPHSKATYSPENIKEALHEYDVFITGSDQVWTLDRKKCNPDFFLEFVPDTKTKISYAAGMCKIALTPEDSSYLKQVLSGYCAVSVREDNTQKLLSEICPDVFHALDPTLLISKEEWYQIAKPRLIKEEYLFVYLLCPSKESHEIIKDFAAANNLKIAAIVNVNGRYEPLDKRFADIPINDCGAEEFISYYKYANFIFTDSFHGLSFCVNCEKDFFVFLKTGNEFMRARNNRIESLTRLLDLSHRIIPERATIKNLMDAPEVDHLKVLAKLQKNRNYSVDWLKKSLINAKPPDKNPILFISQTSQCTGCGACKFSCQQNCITMEEDTEGFLRPKINAEKCVKCYNCERVCPVLFLPELNTKLSAYAVCNKNLDELEKSTSGGAFYVFAKSILKKQGVVYGAAFDEGMKLKHVRVSSINELPKVCRSKYVQSEIGETYILAQRDLEEGRYVLFSGTPCQIAGLHKFLARQYQKLILVDLICHGVPSPGVWKNYVRDLERNQKAKLKSIDFRDKSKGYNAPSLTLQYDNGTVSSCPVGENEFFRIFALDLTLRKSCHCCQFKGEHRCSDFTLGDLHGIETIIPEINSEDKGGSLVLVHSQKGRNLLIESQTKILYKEVDINAVLKKDGMAYRSAKAHSLRATFFNEYSDMGLIAFFKKYFQKLLFYNKVKTLPGFKILYKIVKTKVKNG